MKPTTENETMKPTIEKETTKPTTDKRSDSSPKKKKRNKFLLDNSRINDVSDVLFDSAVLTVAHSFKAAASFRATEFQELGKDIGQELQDTGRDLKNSAKSFIDTVTLNDDARDAREDDMTIEDEESRMPAYEGIDDSTFAGETAATGDETTMGDETATKGDETTTKADETLNICRSDYISNSDESVSVFSRLFSYCAALNCADCADMERLGGDFLNDDEEEKVVKKDEVDSALVEKKNKEQEDDWKMKMASIDWKRIANEAENEAFGAVNTSSDKKEKKWKLFKRRGSVKK